MAKGQIGRYSRRKLIDIIAAQPESSGDITAVTAGSGLSGGGNTGAVTLNVDYAGSDSIINSATDGTGVTVSNTDLVLISDADDNDIIKYINVSQLPTANASVAGSNSQIQFNASGSMGASSGLVYNNTTSRLGLGVTALNATHAITLPDNANVSGRMIATAYITYSSARLKENISKITNPLEILKNIQGITFDWKQNKKKDIGFIAEDVGKCLPHIVQWEKNNLDAQGLDYNKIIPILVEAVKVQQVEIDVLRHDLTYFKNIISTKE